MIVEMMSINWNPETFAVGDTVIDPDRPEWGRGTVVRDSSAPRSPTVGQKLHINWEARGLVMVFTAKRNLRRVDCCTTNMP
jgi:hypothetical protein